MISLELEFDIFHRFFIKGEYIKLDKNDPSLQSFLQKNEIKFKYVNAIRNNHITNHIIQQHHKIVYKKAKILKEYERGESVLELSKKYDYPPFGLSKILNINIDIPENLDSFTNPKISKMVNEKSYRFEIVLGEKLKKLGLKFRTQEDLIAQGVSPTPDFLFDEEITLNSGEKIIWIDAKNSFGGNNKFTKSRLKKQNDKYIKHFGHGMFVFRYSYSEGIKLDNTILSEFKQLRKILTKSHL